MEGIKAVMSALGVPMEVGWKAIQANIAVNSALTLYGQGSWDGLAFRMREDKIEQDPANKGRYKTAQQIKSLVYSVIWAGVAITGQGAGDNMEPYLRSIWPFLGDNARVVLPFVGHMIFGTLGMWRFRSYVKQRAKEKLKTTPSLCAPTFATGLWDITAPKYFEVNEDGANLVIAKIDWPRKLGWDFYPGKNEKVELRVADCSKVTNNEFCQLKAFMKDGFVGAGWYADKVWRLDYVNKQVSLAPSLTAPLSGESLPLGFRIESGKRTTHQPRMGVEIDGTKHDMLFDTGATAFYSEDARRELGLGKVPLCAASFIRRSVFDDLIKRNPNWKVILAGDKFSGGNDLIQVPSIKLGKHEVGPVWFAARNDKIYDYYSSTMMDQNIDGAIGGNVFKYFSLTVDYPNARLYLERGAE